MRVYRYKKPGSHGIMPAKKVPFYGRIDIGIFQCFEDICLAHSNIIYDKELHSDDGKANLALAATYLLK